MTLCRKCDKRIRRGLGCLFCGRPICYTCKCDCPAVQAIIAAAEEGRRAVATEQELSTDALSPSVAHSAPK